MQVSNPMHVSTKQTSDSLMLSLILEKRRGGIWRHFGEDKSGTSVKVIPPGLEREEPSKLLEKHPLTTHDGGRLGVFCGQCTHEWNCGAVRLTCDLRSGSYHEVEDDVQTDVAHE